MSAMFLLTLQNYWHFCHYRLHLTWRRQRFESSSRTKFWSRARFARIDLWPTQMVAWMQKVVGTEKLVQLTFCIFIYIKGPTLQRMNNLQDIYPLSHLHPTVNAKRTLPEKETYLKSSIPSKAWYLSHHISIMQDDELWHLPQFTTARSGRRVKWPASHSCRGSCSDLPNSSIYPLPIFYQRPMPEPRNEYGDVSGCEISLTLARER